MKLFALASLALFSAPVTARDEKVIIWNTFQEAETTFGNEVLYQKNEGTIGDGVEFELFPRNPPNTTDGGFYDVDIDFSDKKEGTVTWTLKDNTGAGHIVFDEGSYDRYYLIFEKPIFSATVVSSDNIVVQTSIPYYEERATLDFFESGLEFPVLDNKVLKMFVEPTTDLTDLGQKIVIKVSRDPKSGMGDDTFEDGFSFSAIIEKIKEILGLD